MATYTYDTGPYAIGKRTALSDPSGSEGWTYDSRGRVITDSKTINSAGTFNTVYGYDSRDRVLTMTYPTGEVVTQTYNAMGTLENLRSISATKSYNQWYASNLDYNVNGSVTLMQLGNNLSTNYTYFPNNFRLQSIRVSSLMSLTYSYDNVGNVKGITDTASFSPTAQYQRFTYDDLDRLITATVTGAITGTYNQIYAYNKIGNLTSKAGVTQWYSDPLHIHAVSNLITGSLKLTDTYNLNGNMLQRVELSGSQRITFTQSWDYENRLTTVTNTATSPNVVSKFIYDGDGNRVMQLVISGTSIMTTAYAGAMEIAITPPPTQTQQGGSGCTGITLPTPDRSYKLYYSAGSQLMAMRVLTYGSCSGVLYFLSSDHLGSSSLTTDASGNFVARQLYDAWGYIRSGGGMPTDIGYTGQRLDSGTNLLFMHARYYDSQIGRWSSPDSIIPDESNPQALNRYSYVTNGPLNKTDPTGHITTGECGGNEGCQSDQGNEIHYYMKYLEEHQNMPLAQLTLFWYSEAMKSLSSWRPETDGPLTAMDDPFLLALQATTNDLNDHPGQLPDEIMGRRHALGAVVDIIVIAAVAKLMANVNAGPAAISHRGSTADPANGSTLPRDLREQLAIEEAMSNPEAGTQLPIKMNDPRWPADKGWVKMQLTVDQGASPVDILGAGGPIDIHYVMNTITGATDDFKIILPGQ